MRDVSTKMRRRRKLTGNKRADKRKRDRHRCRKIKQNRALQPILPRNKNSNQWYAK
jgi:hypothetical protein